jgi:hypothetical protein
MHCWCGTMLTVIVAPAGVEQRQQPHMQLGLCLLQVSGALGYHTHQGSAGFCVPPSLLSSAFGNEAWQQRGFKVMLSLHKDGACMQVCVLNLCLEQFGVPELGVLDLGAANLCVEMHAATAAVLRTAVAQLCHRFWRVQVVHCLYAAKHTALRHLSVVCRRWSWCTHQRWPALWVPLSQSWYPQGVLSSSVRPATVNDQSSDTKPHAGKAGIGLQ